MEHKKMMWINMKKISDYIVSFAFLYSSFICFNTSVELWVEKKYLAILLFFCGLLSFLAVFRFSIAKMIYFLRGKIKDEGK